MAVRTVLIVGGSGFLGVHLAQALRDGYKVFSTYGLHPITIPGVTCIPFRMHDGDWVKRVVYTAAPDIVIYAGGLHKIDWAEKNAQIVEKMHVNGPAAVLKSAIIFQPKFIYLSSPYVFDGSRGNYREHDIVLASTVLGRFKISGENFVRGRSPNYVLMRLSPVLGRGNVGNPSFLDEVRMKLGRNQRIELAIDEVHSFVTLDTVIETVQRFAEGGPRNKVIHVGGLTKLSPYDWGRAFARRFGYDESLIVAKKGDLTPATSERSTFDYSLNSTELITQLKVQPHGLEEGLEALAKLYAGARG